MDPQQPRPSFVPHYLVHGSHAHMYLKIPPAQMSEKKRENIKVKVPCSGVNFPSGFSETIALLSHILATHIGPRAAKTKHTYIFTFFYLYIYICTYI